MTNSLETLFAFVPPEQLRRSILEVFFAWLIETKELPKNYQQVAEDVYFLLKMLEEEGVGSNSEQQQ